MDKKGESSKVKKHKCVYPNCKTLLEDKQINFYAFPLDNEKYLKKWIAAIGIQDFVPTADDLICQKHFPEKCFENNILNKHAIPMKAMSAIQKKIEEAPEFDICRICGKVKETLMTDIFDDDLDICEKISRCLPIFINPNDSLPQTICDECYDHLDVASNLITKCLETESKLKKLFNPEDERMGKPIPLTGPIVCDKCDVFFSDMTLFHEHMSEHDLNDSVKEGSFYLVCSDCGHKFPDNDTYGEHKINNTYNCNLCEQYFDDKCSLNTHKCSKYSCELCGLNLKTEPLLKKHVLQKHISHDSGKGEKIEMEECESSGEIVDLKTKAVFRNGKVRQRKELYHCNICDIKFTSNKKLRDHCVQSHGTSNVLWICKFCGKSMTTKVSLQIHQRIHFDSKPYICEWCGNGYRSRANLNQHQVTHTGVRNHACPKCGKRFSRKAFVRTHMRVHTGERPYVCDMCGQRFTQLGDMKRHRNRHDTQLSPFVHSFVSDNRFYACDYCGETFTHIAQLRKHRFLHDQTNREMHIIEDVKEIHEEDSMDVGVKDLIINEMEVATQ